MAGKRGSSSSVKGKKSVDSKNEPKTRKSLRNSSGSQQQALEALDVETDESGSEQGDAGEEEIIAYHRSEGKGEGDHEDEESSVPIRAAKKPPVFKSNSFFKLNNNLMLSGKINGRNLLSSSAGQKGNKSNNKKSAMVSNQRKANPIEEAQRNSAIYDPNINAAPPLIPAKSKREKTLGKGWFDMKPATLDGSMKGDIKMVEMRNYLDPKRFYKNPDKIKKVLHVGTVVEGAAEYTTNRMTKKERKQSLVGEIIADKQIKEYTKRKYVEIQQEKEAKSGRKKRSKKPGQRDGIGSGSRKVRKLF